MTFETWLPSVEPGIPLRGAAAVLELAGAGGTVPFIARYRKEQTGNLDEVAIQKVLDAKERWDETLKRQTFIVEEIERQKKLTPELREKVLSTFDRDALEDLYLPYKRKRKTKATLAKEAGIEPLADWIWKCGHGTEQPLPGQTLELWAFTFRNAEAGFPELAQVLEGAQDILTERLAEIQELRQMVRKATLERGHLRSQKGEEAKAVSKYERYFAHQEPIQALLKPESSHRYLAMRRGWMEKELSLGVSGPPDDSEYEERLAHAFEAAACTVPDSPGAAILLRAARLALKAQVLPSIENEVHRALKEVADVAAIKVFAENLRGLLLASPFGSKAVLGVDPGQRTGCKLAVVDDSGKYLSSAVMKLQNQAGQAAAKKLLGEILEAVPVKAIAVGNGTAGRETESFLRSAVKEAGTAVPVVMVNEAGASVYSASEVAREEFPALDLTIRGAVSIARRLQDPLAELVKIEPRSIGVGQYQHDVAPNSLKKSLDLVVDSCVNQVGVDLNTASYHLLSHVSGIGPILAKAVVERRQTQGLFHSRQQLLEVPRFTKKTFEQAGGFLRIPGAPHPLDNTGVHPERYAALEALAQRLGKQVRELLGPGVELVRQATELREQVGDFTHADIVRELEKPGRDPREQFVPFAYREDIHNLEDLKPGMKCPGLVTNVTNFGAFVDIGVHQDGLVHVSQISDRFVKDPREVVHPGMRVEVRVLEINLEKHQIALTLKREAPRKAPGEVPKKDAEGREPARKPSPRPPEARAAAGRPPSGPPRPPGGKPHDRRPRPEERSERKPPPLNNPFAVLADLKKTLRSR
ncbi:MAG TPA: Tex family protein [Vicinamibacteria bacterium]|nr:Tex family protein [Vicinamibacteria bacterium]